MTITTAVKAIQDIMRKDVGVDGDAQRISQIVWMLFLKIFDDREQEIELKDDNYKSPIPDRLRWRNWAADPEGMTGEDLMDFVNNDLFRNLKNLKVRSGADQRALLIRSLFADAYNYMKSGTLMRQVINKINEIDFNRSSDRHLFNDIYEKILKDLQSAGNAGEYYTPRAVTQFMVDMVAPRLGEKILDPACGTGGFLVCAIENIRQQDVKTVKDEETLQKSIHGVEKKALPHLLCVTNMLLHEIDVPVQIQHDNTLAKPLRGYGPRDRVDVVVTNPPFGGMEEDGIENNFPKTFRTRETADLFLVLIMHILKEGGRAAVVLPDGTLFGEGIKTRIKEKLLAECNLHTIVRLPNGVFNPYTGIKTNLLFFTKGEPTRDIWFYEHPYPPGAKSYSKTKPMRIEEFEPEKKWWKKRRQNQHAWKVSAEDIRAGNYNLDIKNPHTKPEENGDPDKLLTEYQALLKDIAQTRQALKEELKKALER
ncbi:MAG: class I SAM-dependent DNA methyltransferase [Thermodesulfobacteriota bacterium]|nr:class I SAM-dependent DNA methyltransferase [Thermodesulfobacteriota bacterium]